MKLDKTELLKVAVEKLTQHKENGVFVAYSMGAAEQLLRVRDAMLDQVDVTELYDVNDAASDVVLEDIKTWFDDKASNFSNIDSLDGVVVNNVIQPTPTEEFEANLREMKQSAGMFPKIVVILIDLMAEAVIEVKGIYLPK